MEILDQEKSHFGDWVSCFCLLYKETEKFKSDLSSKQRDETERSCLADYLNFAKSSTPSDWGVCSQLANVVNMKRGISPGYYLLHGVIGTMRHVLQYELFRYLFA